MGHSTQLWILEWVYRQGWGALSHWVTRIEARRQKKASRRVSRMSAIELKSLAEGVEEVGVEEAMIKWLCKH